MHKSIGSFAASLVMLLAGFPLSATPEEEVIRAARTLQPLVHRAITASETVAVDDLPMSYSKGKLVQGARELSLKSLHQLRNQLQRITTRPSLADVFAAAIAWRNAEANLEDLSRFLGDYTGDSSAARDLASSWADRVHNARVALHTPALDFEDAATDQFIAHDHEHRNPSR